MKLQRLLSLVRQAVDDYDLIDDQDHIAVGVSGGKDSLALLYALHEPVSYTHLDVYKRQV